MCGIVAVLTLAQYHSTSRLTDFHIVNGRNGHEHGAETHRLGAKNVVTTSQDQINEALDVIKHRGPDSYGSWISDDQNVALGSCRLAINDLSPSGNQPFENADETVHVVANGEIYDYQRIREYIIDTTGYSFRGTSDCEIIVALYEYYGVSFLSLLRGEFSICLYDSKKQLFLASRDRSGVKPLFWTILEGKILIASEAKAFLAYGWQPEWDVRSIKDLGWITEERTLFKGVRKVRPGHYMTCVSFDYPSQLQYWDHSYPDKANPDPRSVGEMIEGVRSRLLEAVQIRLQADVPVGIHLSGGIDSSVIAGMAKHLLDTNRVRLGSNGAVQKLQCLGVAFDKTSGYDESDIAQRTSDWLSVDFRPAQTDETELAANFEDAVWHNEQIHGDLGFIGKHVLSKLTRDSGLKTILSGQGSDEIFGGYPFYQTDYLREQDQSLLDCTPPEQWRIDEYEKAITSTYAPWPNEPFEADYLRSGVAPRSMDEAPKWLNFVRLMSPQIEFAPWTDTLGQCPPEITITEDISEYARQLMRFKWHPVHSAFYVWNKTMLPNMLLTDLTDRTEMSHSVEGRTPFLDHHLMEYVNNLPPSVKIRYDTSSKVLTEKWILREAAKPFITQEIYERKKHPYIAPSKHPVGGPLNQLMGHLITQKNIEALGFLDWSRMDDLVQQAFKLQEPGLLRKVFMVAQYVVLSQRFGMKTAGL